MHIEYLIKATFKHQKSLIFVALKNLQDFWDQKSGLFLA